MEPTDPKSLLVKPSMPLSDEDQESIDAPDMPKVKLERFQQLERVIRDSPITEEPYLELAQIYLQSSRPADATRVLNLALERFDDKIEVLYLHEESQLLRSQQLFQIAKREHDAEPTALTERALQRCQVDLNVLREKVCRARLERDPEQVDLLLPLAGALDILGKKQEAIECLRRAAEVPKLRAAASLQLGHALQRARQVPAALAAYRRAALFRVPGPTDEVKRKALAAAADLAEASGMVDSARRYVELLLDLAPGDADMTARLGRLREMEL